MAVSSPTSTETTEPRMAGYWAFISYSHTDKRWAARLQRRIERFRVPRRFVAAAGSPLSPIPKRFRPCFRDQEELASSSDLGDGLRKVLRESHYLIVVCSSSSAASRWVNEEVRYFIEQRGASRVFCVVVEGELPNCLPSAVTSEPLAVDVRPGGERWRRATIRLLAGMLGVGFDVLWRRAHRRQVSQWLIATAGVMAIFAGVEFQQRRLEQQQSRVLLVAAEDAFQQGVYDRALRLTVLSARHAWWRASNPDAAARLAQFAHLSPEVTRVRYQGEVTAAFSPDGHRVVTSSVDKTVRVFDARTGTEFVRANYEAGVLSANFSPDAQLISTLVVDGTARILDAKTGVEVARIIYGDDDLNSAFFSPDGQRILIASDDGTARVWDVRTGREIVRVTHEIDGHEMDVRTATFSADRARILSVDEAQIAVSYARSGKNIVRIATDGGYIRSAAFSPDGRLIVAADDDSARVYDAWRGTELRRIAHADDIRSAQFSADGRLIVSADDRTVRVSDAVTAKPLFETTLESGVTQVAFSPDVRQVAVASMDGVARVLAVPGGQQIAAFNIGSPVRSASFSPEALRLVTGSDEGIAQVWDLRVGRASTTIVHGSDITSAGFSADARILVTSSYDGTARMSDSASAATVRTVRHRGAVQHAALSPDGTRFVTAGEDKTTRASNAETGEELWRVEHQGRVFFAGFSADGARVLSASADGTVRVIDALSGREISRVSHDARQFSPGCCPEFPVWAFSSDGQRLLTAADNRTVRVTDAMTGTEIVRLVHPQRFYSAAFSLDGSQVVTASTDRYARVFDASTGRPLAEISDEQYVYSARFSPDGNRLITAHGDRAWIVDTANGRKIVSLASGGLVADFAYDGQRVVTYGGHAREAGVSDAATGKVLTRLPHDAAVSLAKFSPDSRLIVTAANNIAYVWDIGWLARHGRTLLNDVCTEKLRGTRHVSPRDVERTPLLAGREGEDVCEPKGLWARLASLVRIDSISRVEGSPNRRYATLSSSSLSPGSLPTFHTVSSRRSDAD